MRNVTTSREINTAQHRANDDTIIKTALYLFNGALSVHSNHGVLFCLEADITAVLLEH